MCIRDRCDGMNRDGLPADWTYETEIPCERFDIWEDGEVYCVGSVSYTHLDVYKRQPYMVIDLDIYKEIRDGKRLDWKWQEYFYNPWRIQPHLSLIHI